MFYMYTPDLAGPRQQLLANGVKVPAIGYPEYMPSGKINIADPDGYKIEIGHGENSSRQRGRTESARRSNRCEPPQLDHRLLRSLQQLLQILLPHRRPSVSAVTVTLLGDRNQYETAFLYSFDFSLSNPEFRRIDEIIG
jgi:hypothetical protein